jgi:mono/diheme cytochrome c family protein
MAEIQNELPPSPGSTSAGAAGMTTFAGAGSPGGGASTGGGGSGGLSAAGSLFSGAAGAQAGDNGGSGGLAGAAGAGPVKSEGQTLFEESCAVCHGIQGDGAQFGPELHHPVRDYARWVVRNGRAQTSYVKPMEKLGPEKISDAQLELVFDYLSTPPQPTTGAALFADYCANCHGADARGGPTMRDLLNEVDKIDDLVRGGKNAGQFQLRRDYMPKFGGDVLSDEELLAITQYVDSL